MYLSTVFLTRGKYCHLPRITHLPPPVLNLISLTLRALIFPMNDHSTLSLHHPALPQDLLIPICGDRNDDAHTLTQRCRVIVSTPRTLDSTLATTHAHARSVVESIAGNGASNSPFEPYLRTCTLSHSPLFLVSPHPFCPPHSPPS